MQTDDREYQLWLWNVLSPVYSVYMYMYRVGKVCCTSTYDLYDLLRTNPNPKSLSWSWHVTRMILRTEYSVLQNKVLGSIADLDCLEFRAEKWRDTVECRST